MRKTVCILIIIAIVIIIACSNKKVVNHNYIYRGENESWMAEYKVNGTGIFTEKNNKTSYESNCSKEFTITYKKDLSEISSVKHLEIAYKSSVGGGKITEDYDEGESPQKTYTMHSGGNGAIEVEDEVIKVTINLDGNIQTFELKNIIN